MLVSFIKLLKTEMTRPEPWGIFHISWLVAAVLLAWVLKRLKGEKVTERVFTIYGWTALILEALKQFSWSFTFTEAGGLVFGYQWYSAPFQICTTPAYVCVLYNFVKSSRLRSYLRAYLAYFTLIASIMVALVPNTVFTNEILINVHTSFLHIGALFVSVWLLESNRVDARQDFLGGYKVFFIFVGIAQLLNIVVYNAGWLNGQTFDMFYISPYFISSLPVFDTIDRNASFAVFMLTYLFAFFLGGGLIAFTQGARDRLSKHFKQKHV